MIEARSLSKSYGPTPALRDVSFRVEPGEVVGFLGPNGAGKSTTMRILAGFLAPSSGSAEVAGRDVARDSLEVRRRVGYLPENNPLYGEMRVDEYLRFRARLRGVPRSRVRARVDDVVERCRLGPMRGRVIDRLSKGYRQRVGLADALVHEPAILILDEPTIGLDPHQTRQVRALVRELGEGHTVLLSSHILSEVEQVCARLLIIAEGRIVAAGTAADLCRRLADAPEVHVEACVSPAELRAGLAGLGEVTSAVATGAEAARATLRAGADVRERVYLRAVERGWTLRELFLASPSLEEVFVRLTERVSPGGPDDDGRGAGGEGEGAGGEHAGGEHTGGEDRDSNRERAERDAEDAGATDSRGRT